MRELERLHFTFAKIHEFQQSIFLSCSNSVCYIHIGFLEATNQEEIQILEPLHQTNKRMTDEDKENNPEPPPNKPSKKRKLFKNSDIEVTEEKYKSDIKSLQEECAKDKPSKTLVKTLMKETLVIRRNWIDRGTYC